MTADNIDEWDSLSHVNLVVAIEKYFKIKFKSSEIIRWKNIGQMFDAIKEKLAEK
jgi:acyl carrier protein